MPSVLCFDTNVEETLQTLAELRRGLRTPTRGTFGNGGRRARGRIPWVGRYRDFEPLELITPAAALVLAAEYERAILQRRLPPFLANLPNWHPSVIETLWEIGFFEIVGFKGAVREPPAGPPDTTLIRMKSGQTEEPTAVAALIDDLKQLYPHGADEDGTLVSLYGAMIEAVGNVVSHAYPAGAEHEVAPIGRWWMTGAVNTSERRMTAVVFDQGITIPVSLPNWTRYAGWRRRMLTALMVVPSASDTRSDGLAIATAVEESVSSTGHSHRGQGLAQMRRFVDQCADGHLRIMSRCGEVVFRPHSTPEIYSRALSVGGTLIEWNVLLSESRGET